MPTKFTRLTGEVGNVSGLMRLKRLGKIRLGIKKRHAQTGKEYPSAIDSDGNPIDYFVIDKDLQDALGEKKPKVIECIFASNDPEEVYQEKLALYGNTTGLKCHGNGQVAMRRQENGQWLERKCPCEFLKTDDNPKGQCTAQGHLMVVIPKVSMWGYFQLTTHSIYARAGILSSLKQLQETVGRIAFIPLRLSRVPQDITYKGHSKTHYIVGFDPALNYAQTVELKAHPELLVLPAPREIEAPLDTNPADDPVDVVVDHDDEENGNGEFTVDAEAIANMDDDELAAVQKALNAQRAQRQQPRLEATAPAAQGPAPQRAADEPRCATPKNGGDNPVPWDTIVKAIESNSQWCDIKDAWRESFSPPISQIAKMNDEGKKSLLDYLRIQALDFPY